METRTLSRTEARVVLGLEADARSELTLAEIRHRARISEGFARKIASELRRKGWLQRLGPGRYLLNPSHRGPDPVPDTDPLRFGSHLVRPYYFGFATAAELHGLLPQTGRVFFVATPLRRTLPATPTAEYRAVHIPRSRFFGTRHLRRRGEDLVVSDVERTLLDCLDRPELAGGLAGVTQMLHSAGGRIDYDRLTRYLRRWHRRSFELRLGFLMEATATRTRPPRRWLARLAARPGEPYIPLGSPVEFGRRGPHDIGWHIIQNVPERRLRAEVDIR